MIILYRMLQRAKKKKILHSWIKFTNYCKINKAKILQAQDKIQKYRVKTCFKEFKKLLILRANRLEFEEIRKKKELKTIFRGFKHVIDKSIDLSEAYVEVACRYRQRIAREVLEKWYIAAEEQIQAKESIAIELENQRQQEIYTYHFHIMRKAFEALKINMAPRTKTMNRLVEKYHIEQLKTKAIKSFKEYIIRKRKERQMAKNIETETKLKYFKCWLMLYNEINISKSLRTPFVNLQKQAYEEDWSLSKLNLNTEKVYS